jgi:hypothetical protein
MRFWLKKGRKGSQLVSATVCVCVGGGVNCVWLRVVMWRSWGGGGGQLDVLASHVCAKQGFWHKKGRKGSQLVSAERGRCLC